MSEPRETRPLRVGEVAKATGLTLQHYDDIGLLVPSGRTGAGYRLYSDGDVRRLVPDPRPVMSRMEQYYTPEQAEQLERRAAALGEDGLRRAEAEWAEPLAAVEAERAAGTDPADPLVERWIGLIEQFTGGDPGIRASLKRMYAAEGPERASRGAVDAGTMAYATLAMDARGDHPA